jgi:hypothetical protein
MALAPRNLKTRPLAERFWRYVYRTPTCWIWFGAKKELGYGVMGRGRRGEGIIKAHRASWEIHHGPIPEGRNVLHRCDRPECVNPEHLYLGSLEDNARDMAMRDRVGGCCTRRLNKQDVLAIRAHQGPQREMMKKYNISQAHVSDIKLRRCWKHV